MEAYESYDRGELLHNRYSKVNDISEGSYGLVSLAKDTKNENVLVAVKYIFPIDYKRSKQISQLSNTTGRATSSPAKLRSNAEADSSDSKQKVMISALCEESSKEIAIHKILGEHSNIPKLIDFFDSYLILEYCSKGDLYEAMQNDVGPTTSQDIKDVFAQILSAISYCHSKSVFHRDLKPENILIALDWSIKVCDWGLATTQQIITNPSEFDIGSERYMAPELFDPELRSYDAAKVDLWSLGVILLTLVFHKNPFQVANYTDKRFLQFSANREALFDFFSSMTGEMFSALRFCLTMDPSNRDLESFREELQGLKYFTIDEEYWAMHISDDDGAQEDIGYEEDDEENEEGENTLPGVEFHDEETFQFDPECAELDHLDPRFAPRQKDSIKITTPADLPQNQIQLSIDEVIESDLTLAMGTANSSKGDETMPYNRRADALLSPTTDAKPIPIGGGQQIRNTRKPFGVASYNKNGAFSGSYKHPGNYNGHSSSHGNKFRREDFFTPRSVFSHYMDKYGEQRDHNDAHRPYEKKKKVWNTGRKKQSWKKKGSSYQPNNVVNTANVQDYQARRNIQSRVRRQPRPATALPPTNTYIPSSPSQFPMSQNGLSPMSIQCGARNAGKYVPPFMRSPRVVGKASSVDAVAEEIDHLALNDGEVFVLEDDYLHEEARRTDLTLSHRALDQPIFGDYTNESPYNKLKWEGRRSSMTKADNLHPLGSGKYVPPFRRGSMGVPAEKRRSLISNGSPFPSLLQTALNEEVSRSVPGS